MQRDVRQFGRVIFIWKYIGVCLLGNEDAGSGRVQVLSINTVDLVTSTQVRVAGPNSVVVLVGQADVETLNVSLSRRTLRATLLDRLGRRDEDIVVIGSGGHVVRRLSLVAAHSLGELRTIGAATGVGRSVLVGRGRHIVKTSTCTCELVKKANVTCVFINLVADDINA